MANAKTDTPASAPTGLHVKIEPDVLAAAAKAAQRVVGSRASLPILSGVRLIATDGTLTLSATDLELALDLTVAADVQNPGSVVVPGRLFADVAGVLPRNAVDLKARGDLEVRAGGYHSTLRTLPLEDWPALAAQPDDDDPTVIKLTVAALTAVLTPALSATSSDDARPVLTGVYLERTDRLQAIATDSYRLHLSSAPEAADKVSASALVPRRAVGEVLTACRDLPADAKVTVTLTARTARFELPGRTYTTQLVEGGFPDYRQLISGVEAQRILIVDVAAIIETVKRVAAVGDNTSATPVRLALTNDGPAGEALISSGNAERGTAEERITVDFNGEPVTMAFNIGYLLAALAAVGSPHAVLQIRDELKPVIIRRADVNGTPDVDGPLALLMPVRL